MQYKDQIGNRVDLAAKPLRVISLVPSQSEFLWDLGLREELIGITKFCIHPDEMFRSISRIGGTKKLDLDKIRSLKPDLIIGNKEENQKEQIEILQKEFPVWMSDIYTFEDSFQMMENLGQILEKQKETQLILEKLKASLLKIKALFKDQEVAYFIWNKPYMCAAKDTFIDHVLSYLGLENALGEFTRYPELTEEDLRRINPEVCFLSSEPFPFKEEHIKELQRCLPEAKILIVDGEVFSWYGTRLLHLEKYVQGLPLRHSEH
ncbi:cobalamin-binding protein [Sphingobacteriaceae bacterium]|nr:cobalamin-binding protein [Sphingobacteriaceae bacterium]